MERKAAILLGWVCATMLIILVGLCAHQRDYPFSQRQPMDTMRAEYDKCKANAPEGFDCYMQPVLVSETFISEEVNK